MRLGGEPESSNFEDRTGQSGGGFGGGGFGGGGLGCLIPLVMSRFGIGGVVVLLIGYFLLSSLGGGGGGILPGSGGTQQVASGQSTLTPESKAFLTHVLGSTEQTWSDIFAKQGHRYEPTTMVAYSGGTQTGCGYGQAAAGPFYCPEDGKVYIDPSFFNELSKRFGAPGDAAAAYVIAHEVGHHVQDLLGGFSRGGRESNADQVRIELQADCYAGVWAASARDQQGSILEAGDAQEALRAAEAVGDDTLQKRSQGYVVPDSFTHGTSVQRMAALNRGLTTADPNACKL